MKGKGAWVTCAGDIPEALKALVLVRSLRKVLTRFPTVVFATDRIPPNLKAVLTREFDVCYDANLLLDQSSLESHFDLECIRCCLEVGSFRKFAYVHCDSIFLKNGDSLLGKDGGVAYSTCGDLIFRLASSGEAKERLLGANGLRKESANQTDDGSSSKEFKKQLGLAEFKEIDFQKDLQEIRIVAFNASNSPIQCGKKGNGFEGEDTSVGRQIKLLYKSLARDDLLTLVQNNKVDVSFNLELNPTDDALPDIPVELEDSIAVVGMSFRLPGANTMEEFWELLKEGKEAIIKVPEGRWNEETCMTDVQSNFQDTEAGFLTCPVDEMDAKFFGLSPKEVSYMDPQQRMILELVWEGLEHACINPKKLRNTQTGVFGGWWRNDFKEILQEAGGLQSNEFFRTYMGNTIANVTSRISHVLELTGPSISTESGCSTSIVAVDMACKSLLNEDCDLAVALGVNLFLHPFSAENFAKSIIAPDGRCKTFDASADGFGRAEGCTVLVLKRFGDAVRDNDRVWGLIRGTAVVQEGLSKSIGTPTIECEALAMKLALQRANVQPEEVEFVETHGTGTPVGDPLEVAAIAEAYGRGRKVPLTIGSVKTNIGHTESCSGIAGIIKTLLVFEHEMIPRHINFESLNPDVNLDVIPANIPLKAVEWKRREGGRARLAGVSSFGITGTDAHAILQESPFRGKCGAPMFSSQPSCFLLKLSAQSEDALAQMKTNYDNFLRGNEADQLMDVVYSANVGRSDMAFRTFAVGKNKAELLEGLAKSPQTKKPAAGNKVCFLFTGQGSQHPGMAKALYDEQPLFRAHFNHCARILETSHGIRIKDAMWGKDVELLKRTVYSQTSIFVVEICLLRLWESWGVTFDAVVGHSLGEFAAAVAAGILTTEEALTLVATRSNLIDALPQGKMLVVKAERKLLELLVERASKGRSLDLDFAAVNSKEQTVLAGSAESVAALQEVCVNNGLKSTVLASTHAFHSRHMDAILDEYEAVAAEVQHKPPRCTFVSGMEGTVVEGPLDAKYWRDHTRKGVEFLKASKTVLQEVGCNLFLEVGPQPVLSSLLMENADEFTSSPISCFPSIRRNEDAWTTILTSLGKLYVAGVDVDWGAFHQFSVGKKITIPFYPFQRKKYPMEIGNDRPKSIHPLVGTVVSNPSDTKLFHNSLSLEQSPFLKDHVIGSTFLFPGAGFLEMLLVGGYAGTQCLEGSFQLPVSPISIHDFQIEAPFALQEGSKTQVQVTLAEENGNNRVSMFSRLQLSKGTWKWVKHASASFHPLDTLDKPTQDILGISTVASIQSRCSSKIETDKTYGELLKHGYKFGPTFQTLKAAWRNPERSDEFLCEVAVTCSSDSHVIHPVMIDALFQAAMLSASPDGQNMRLFVPVSISKFVWYKKISTDTCYIHRWTSKEESYAVLYDANGERVAVMIGAMLLETTISSIMINLESQKASLPRMFEDVWRSQLGPKEKRVPHGTAYFEDVVFEQEFQKQLEKYNYPGGDVEVEYHKANFLYLHFFIKAFRELGWEYGAGERIHLDKIMSSLSILPQYKKFTRYLLLELSKDGFLSGDDDLFEVIKAFPSLPTLNGTIESLMKDPVIKGSQEINDISSVALKLGEILSGKISALPLLFPENLAQGAMGPAEAYYKSSHMYACTKQMMIDVQPHLYNTLNPYLEANKGKSVFRVLEVGAGTGSSTEIALQGLTLDPSSYEYTYTDISAVFFKNGESIFANSGIKAVYKTLNIEEDVFGQGYVPHQYDLIIASFVLHATRDIRQTMSNIQRLVAPKGTVIIMELCQPLRAVNILFGTLEGFSRFNDYGTRKHNCELTQEKWVEVLNDMGFQRTTHFSAYYNHSAIVVSQNSSSFEEMKIYKSPEAPCKEWIVFCRENEGDEEFFSRKLRVLGRGVRVVGPKSSGGQVKEMLQSLLGDKSVTYEGILFLWGHKHFATSAEYPATIEAFLGVCKALSLYSVKAGSPSLKLMVVTSELQNVNDDTNHPPFASVMFGMSKALQNENTSVMCRCVDLSSSDAGGGGHEFDAVIDEMFIDDSEFTVAYRGGQRNVKRFTGLKAGGAKSLPIPKSERFRLTLPSTNAISDLRFSPAKAPQLGDFDVEIRVKTYSMNFRDVLVILKPTKFFEDMTAVGYDFSGVVTAVGPKVTKRKVGDEVIGFNQDNDSLPSHVRASEDLLQALPDGVTFAEAATLPAVVATVYVCLVKVAKLKKEDTVLIHTGSGGVGLCAIQLAKAIGCRIVSTAGSQRKRTYLRNLGIQFVYNSRNTDYEAEILRDVGGVDVVLNSLTSGGFKEATLGSCKPGARFVEMSKLNVWSAEDVKAIRPDVVYSLVDISDPTEEETVDYIKQVEYFRANLNVKPLPYVRFEAGDIREALNYMQKAKHIGKVILAMPEPDAVTGWKVNLFNDKSSYLVTGGLGGIGVEIAKWMVGKGAKHVILAGRNPPKPKTQREIDEMNAKGGNVFFRKCDVGYVEECRALLHSIKSEGLPQLRGIMHAAGVLSDASYENQTWEKFQETFHPKVNGGWNLHSLTLDYPLEHFVMFSSAAASLGSLGQSNHSAANNFLDHLAFYRHSMGLPGSTVNWGQWGQVGVAANIEVIGIKPFSTLQATSALELSMRNHQLQVCVCEADYDLWRKTFSSTKKYLEELKISSDSGRKTVLKLDGEVFWKEYDEAPEEGPEKQNVVKKYLHLVIREVLRLGEADPLDDDLTFQDMGMDSLMMIEMKNLIQTILGERVKISIGAVKDCATINQMSIRIVELVAGDDGDSSAVPTRDELNILIREDSVLDEDIQLPENKSVCKPSEIRTVLVTGVTGNYGPYVLQDLAKRSHIERIYCLVRPLSNQSGTERLEKVLQSKGINDVRMEMVTCINGTIIDPHLGMATEQYASLAEEVDAVIHLSVRAEILEYYRKAKTSEKDARSVNVLGTKNILRFACSKKLKHVYHASTMMTAVAVDKEGRVAEEWPRIESFDHLPNSAYVTSKFIGDLVIANAVERGIPCKLFRLPFLGGDRKTGGNTDLMGNHLILRVLSYMYIGMMPATPMPFPILPVDQAAELANTLFFNDGTGYELYNVCNPRANDELEIRDITEEFGYKVEVVEPDVFFDKVEKMENTEVAKLAKITVQRQGDHMRTEASMPEMFLAWMKSRDIFLSRKMQRWIPEYPNCFESSIDLLRKDLKHAKDSGVFAKVGLK